MVVCNTQKAFKITKEMEKTCHNILYYICNKLDIKRPILYFEEGNHCNYTPINKGIIRIGYNHFKYKTLALFNITFKENKINLLFSLLHELCHHIQYTKYYNWYNLHENEWLLFDEVYSKGINNQYELNIKYQQLKLEKNANKMSLALIKRFYPEVLNMIEINSQKSLI